MLRLAVAVSCVLGTGCFAILPQDDAIEGATCGDAKVEYPEICDDGNQRSGDGCSMRCLHETTVNVHWRLATLANEPQACPAGFATAEVIADHARLSPPYAPLTQTVACATGQAQVLVEQIPHSPEPWNISVRIRNGTAGEVFGESRIDPVIPTGTAIDSFHTIVTDAGTIAFGWSLRQGTNPSTCEALGVTAVQVEWRPMAGPSLVQTFSCTEYHAVTPLMPAGTYQLVVTAGTATATIDEIRVSTGGKTTMIGPVDLVF